MSDRAVNGPIAAPWLTVERLGALTDGVIAIIVTLLVLGIEVPEGHDFASEGVVAFLLKIEHEILLYLASFFLVWAYWLQHHVMFHYVARTNRTIVYLNGFFLFLLSLLPFTTDLAGMYHGVPIVETVFGINYFLSGVVLFAMWRYSVANPYLLRKPIDDIVQRSVGRRILIAPALSLLGILVAMIHFRLGNLIFVSIPLYYLSHPIADTHWRSED